MNKRLVFLFDRYYRQTISPDEREELLSLLGEKSNQDALKQLILNTYSLNEPPDQLSQEQSDSILSAIFSIPEKSPAPARRILFKRNSWLKYAAAIILMMGIGLYFYYPRNAPPRIVKAVRSENDMPPGRRGALLTLADGRVVALDSLKNGLIANQSGTEVLLIDGKLTYDPVRADQVSFNTITTPQGRQFQLVLPDGTAVWLNAASSISYPTSFTGKERKVTISGEAYLEVAKNPAMPFIVVAPSDKSRGAETQIEVLGTHFNVNAYGDEDFVKTTLLEGEVKVRSGRALQQLKPGSQAWTAHDGSLTRVDHADVNEAIAWKNGFFYFKRATLQEVMRRLARWYDVEVEYEGKSPDLQFGGKIQQDLKLSEVLEGLEQSQIRFRIEGRKLIASSIQ